MIRLLCIIFCACYLKEYLCTPFNYTEEFAKIRRQMKAAKLEKAEDQVEYLLQLYVDEKEEKKREQKRANDAEKDKEMAEALNKRHLIPLTVRAYATMIEDEFPDIKNNHNSSLFVPADIWKKTQGYNKPRVLRKYKFRKTLKVGEEDGNEYVLLIIEGLDEYFRERNNLTGSIDKGSQEYERFILRFCDSVVKAIEFGNSFIAHAQSGGVVKLETLGVFDNVVDTNMAIFYNSVVGTGLASEVKKRMDEAYPDENKRDE